MIFFHPTTRSALYRIRDINENRKRFSNAPSDGHQGSRLLRALCIEAISVEKSFSPSVVGRGFRKPEGVRE